MANRSIEPIRRSTLSSIVTERLRELVVNGSYQPGAQLNEVDLARRFGVSRGPIREGLQRLVQEGLLRSEQHRGVFIPIMSDDDIADIYLAREAIEGAAMRLAVGSDRGAELADRMRGLVRQMEQAASSHRWSRVAELDMRFHAEVVEAAESPRLSRMFSSLVDETRVLLAMTTSRADRDDPVEQHEALVKALESGDPEAASAALEHHFHESRETMRRQFDMRAAAGRDAPAV